MVVIEYRKTQLVVGALLAAGCTAFFLWLFLDPLPPGHSRWLRLFGGDLGHFVTVPLCVLISAAVAWRLLLFAAGPAHALVFEDDGMKAASLWRSWTIPWREFGGAHIRHVRTRYGSRDELVINRATRGPVTINLGMTDMEGRPDAALETVDLMHARAFALGKRPSTVAAPAALQPEESDFDADAALARYLARKAQAAPEAQPQVPVSRGFGRKGL